MGLLGDDDEDPKSVWDDETQPIDSPCSSPSEPVDGRIGDDNFDDVSFLQHTLPFDTAPVEDQFETQLVNLGDETQVLENLGDETQVLEDLDDVENNATQIVDEPYAEVAADSDSERTDGTEVLEDVPDSSDEEVEVCTPSSKLDGVGSEAKVDSLTDGQHHTETVRRDFTSVRAAALRASGSAARSRASKETNSESLSFKSDDQTFKSDDQTLKLHNDEDNETTLVRDSSAFAKEADQKDLLEVNDGHTKTLRNEHQCKLGSSAARRLFTDDSLAATRQSDDCTNNADLREELPQLDNSGFGTAGLSYVDSQEPGDLSQANALDVVDRLLKFDIGGFDQELNIERSTRGKSEKCLAGAKGVQNLAKITNLKSKLGEIGAFDWDDGLEDEGGGEFFTKKKEAFFDNGVHKKRSSTQPRKVKHLDAEISVDLDQTKHKGKRQDIKQKLQGSVKSNSTLVLPGSRLKGKTAEVMETSERSLTKELNKQLNVGSSDGVEDKVADKNASEMLNVGLDTQIAAEAMEALCFGLYEADHHNEDANQHRESMLEGSSRNEKNNGSSKKDILQKRATRSSSKLSTKISKETEDCGTGLCEELASLSHKQAKKVRKHCDTELQMAKTKKAKRNGKELSKNTIKNLEVLPEVSGEAEKSRPLKRNGIDDTNRCQVVGPRSGCLSVNKRHLQEQAGNFSPIARRTRQQRVRNPLGTDAPACHSGKGIHLTEGAEVHGRRLQGSLDIEASPMLTNEKKIRLGINELTEVEKTKLARQEKSHQEPIDKVPSLSIGDSSCKRRRTRQKRPAQQDGTGNSHAAVNHSVLQDPIWQSLRKSKRLRATALNPSVDAAMSRGRQSSVCAVSGLQSSNRQLQGSLSLHSVDKEDTIKGNCIDRTGAPVDLVIGLEASPGDRPPGSASAAPSNCTTPKTAASPICMGDEYPKQSRRKNLSKSLLVKELNSLFSTTPSPTSTTKDSRRRRDMSNVRVLFSHHLDEDIIKQQKKILTRLGASVASAISEATHFVAEKFVRTSNMLEAIALGKPVVTQLWLESCGQASCFIDERNYILRDSKKEKEFGFSLPVSLARACSSPLLQGRKVFITPNTKPGKEILANLVKAVHGLPVERVGRSALKDKDIPDDLMVLSCEEDFSICVPFLEKGAEIYSSELLLNGIVVQKLECDRHRLFEDHVKKTRSTIWLKHGSKNYRPVTKQK